MARIPLEKAVALGFEHSSWYETSNQQFTTPVRYGSARFLQIEQLGDTNSAFSLSLHYSDGKKDTWTGTAEDMFPGNLAQAFKVLYERARELNDDFSYST